MNIICGFENYVGNDTKRKNVTKKKKVVNLMGAKLPIKLIIMNSRWSHKNNRKEDNVTKHKLKL